jgi:hypothetical protein
LIIWSWLVEEVVVYEQRAAAVLVGLELEPRCL